MTIVLCLIFFLSGAAALIFEALWFRLAGLAFGNSVWAAAVVLASFMGGLACGNWGMSVKGHLIRKPLRLYIWLEIIIAVFGGGLVLIFPHLTAAFVPVFRRFLHEPLILNGIRAGGAFLLMLVPTTAMGATLPVLVKALSVRKKNFGNVLGLLYGANTLGAVVGVLACEFFLVKALGLRGAGIAAALLNVLAAVIAAGWVRFSAENKNTMPVFGRAGNPGRISRRAVLMLVAGFGLGLTFLGLEVIWFRFMLLFYDAFSRNFSIMLAVVLLGIGMGGVVAAFWFKRKPDADNQLAPMILANGILVAIIYAAWGACVSAGAEAFLRGNVLLFSFGLVFPVAVVSGIIFPMLGKVLQEEIRNETRATGLLTLANTLGAMCGPPLAAYVLIPGPGVEKSFFIVSFLYGLIALSIAAGERGRGEQRKQIPFKSIAMVTIFALVVVGFPFGLMEHKFLNIMLKDFHGQSEHRIAYREGINETIQYLRNDLWGLPYYFRLVTNAHTMSSTAFVAKRYMKMFVYLPMALRPQSKAALLICYGTGMTAQALKDSKNLKHIDIVDISSDVFEMSKLVFSGREENPLDDPRVTAKVEDGRFFLLTGLRKYDLITAEPPPPKFSGTVNLYTQDFFQLIYESLNEGGIVTYWLPVYQLLESDIKAIVGGFCNVFPQASLWSGAGLEWMLVGIKNPGQKVSREEFSRQWQDPVVGPEMRSLGFTDPEHFGSWFIADAGRLKRWVGDTPPLRDNYPQRLSSDAVPDKSAVFPRRMEFRKSSLALENFKTSEDIKMLWPLELHQAAENYFDEAYFIDEILGELNFQHFIKNLHRAMDNPQLADCIGWVLDSDYIAQGIVERMVSEYPKDEAQLLEDCKLEMRRAVQQGDKSGGQAVLDRCKQLAVRAVLQGDYRLAERYYEIMCRYINDKEDFVYLRMYLLMRAADAQGAKDLMDEYVRSLGSAEKQKVEQIGKYLIWLNKNI